MHTRQTPGSPRPRPSGTSPSPLQTLVVVAPDLDVLDSLQCFDGGGSYNQVLLSPWSQAYAQVKRWHPSLVVIHMSSEDLEGCQLLTMLTVDPDTQQIPVLILTTPDAPENREVDSVRSTRFWLEPLPGLA